MKQKAIFSLMLGIGVLAGCSSAHYRKSADKEVYQAIREKTGQVPNMDRSFTIEQTNAISIEGLPAITQSEEYLGVDGAREQGAHIISLQKALEMAVHHNRNYQAQKEQLYAQALNLTLARHQFTPIFSGRARTEYQVQTEQAVQVGIDEITGQPKALLSDKLEESPRLSANGSVGTDWLIRDVGRLSAAFTTDFLRFLSGDPRTVTSSQVGATLTRPILRNSGFKQEKESLTQAERNLLYGLREFTLNRKTLTVRVASDYYNVLRARDEVRNSYLNLQSSRKSAERTRALAKEGRVTQADLGRLEQQELSTEGQWIDAIRSYKQALDNFKVQDLGISTDANIVLNDSELEELKIEHPQFSVDDSIKVALMARLDYQNVKDQLDDAKRKVDLGADSLKAQLDLVAGAGFNSPQENGRGFPVPDINRYHWNAGINLDLPLERKAQRNSYRLALIAQEQASRTLSQREDEIKLQVRDSWRTLEQAKRNFEISELGVKLAERRVEEQNLLAELGRAKAQDQVDAQNDLISQKNRLTQALVTHTIARLQFWNNMGILYIKDDGRWEEVKNVQAN